MWSATRQQTSFLYRSLRCCSRLSHFSVRNGFKLHSDGSPDAVECLIEMTRARRWIDVVVRCREGDEIAAKRTLETLQVVIEAVRDEKSPGTPIDRGCYLANIDKKDHN